MTDVSRLRAAMGEPALQWLVERIRKRLEQGGDLSGSVTLRDPTRAQRAAVNRLLGRRAANTQHVTVSLSLLDDVVRKAGLASDLREAIETVVGPVANLNARRARVQRDWEAVFDEAKRRAVNHTGICCWLETLQSSGLLRRLSKQNVATAAELLNQVLGLYERLPADGVPLAEMAATVSGDSHALDAGRPLSTLALRAIASVEGIALSESAACRRDVWAAAGVLCDELSAPILVLNLKSDSNSLTGRALQLHAEAGEPYRVSIRQLLRRPPRFDPAVTGETVFVCENVSVVAAVTHRLGAASKPLVCVDGQPKTAARLLFGALRRAGIQLAYHGDFDWAGIRIANQIMLNHAAIPWRMSTADYRLAAGYGRPLAGRSVAAIWDSALAEAMTARGNAVHEEAVLDFLINDLS